MIRLGCEIYPEYSTQRKQALTTQSVKEKLLNRMKLTKSNRFNLSKRIGRKSQLKSLSINFITLATLFLGILLLSFPNNISLGEAQLFALIVSGLSLVSIFLSLKDPVEHLTIRSNDAHRCGREISKITRKLESGSINEVEASELYEAIVSSYDDNHDEVDLRKSFSYYKGEVTDKHQRFFDFIWGDLGSFISAYSPVAAAIFMISVMSFLIGMLDEPRCAFYKVAHIEDATCKLLKENSEE